MASVSGCTYLAFGLSIVIGTHITYNVIGVYEMIELANNPTATEISLQGDVIFD